MKDARHGRFGYLPALDGMRACAVGVVMLFHANLPVLHGGFIGVDIFFVLSGFLITSVLLKEYERTGRISLKSFYLRRVFRLLPALVLLLLTFMVFSVVYSDTETLWSHAIDTLIVLLSSANWARAFHIHPPDFLGHAWSLSLEEQFYLLWSLLLLAILHWRWSRRNMALFLLGLAVAAWGWRIYLLFHGATVERVYNGLDTRADALLVGCVIGVLLSTPAFVQQMVHFFSRAGMQYLAPVAGVGLIWLCQCMSWRNPHLYHWAQFLIAVLTALMIIDLVVAPQSVLRGLLEQQWLVWTGTISYGLYLWHYPIFRLLLLLEYTPGLVLLLGSLLTFGIASASYYCLERPLLYRKQTASL